MHIPSSAPADVQQAFRDLYAIVAPLDQTRAIDWKTRRLSKLGDATDGADAITKAQVDALIAAVRGEAGLDTQDGPVGALNGVSGKVRVGTYAVRGAAPAHAGELFLASDRNYVGWVSTASAWKYATGVQYGTLSPDQKPTLTTDDVGYRFRSTDFAREYRWSGSAWAIAPGQDSPGTIGLFTIAPTTGWQACDGSSVTRSTTTGGTTSVTVPDYSTATYLKAKSASNTVGPTAASGTTADESAHTHSIDPPSTQSSTPSGTVTVQSGSGQTVADDTHRHNTDIAAFASAAGSAHNHAPGTVELRRTELLAYYRL